MNESSSEWKEVRWMNIPNNYTLEWTHVLCYKKRIGTMAMHNILLHVSFQNNNKDDKNGLLLYCPLQNQSKEILLVNLFNDGFIGEIVKRHPSGMQMMITFSSIILHEYSWCINVSAILSRSISKVL